jgi:hypothetical protein
MARSTLSLGAALVLPAFLFLLPCARASSPFGGKFGPRLRAALTLPAPSSLAERPSSRRATRPLRAEWDTKSRLQVVIRVKPGSRVGLASAITALGGRVSASVGALHAVEAWLTPAALAEIARRSSVLSISLPHYALPRTQVVTQGDQVLGAAKFRQETGITGSGISVGVISDGATDLQQAVNSGNLPDNVWVDPNDSKFGSSGEEGIAMMSIVYALAPGARLGFCGPQTDVEFVQCLDDFESSNFQANIIVDDLGFPGVDMFGNGSFASAVAQFASQYPNVHLVTAAGNDAQAYWQGTWDLKTIPQNSTGPSGYTLNGNTYSSEEDFCPSSSSPGCTGYTGNGGSLQIMVQPGDQIGYIVEWDDPWTHPVGDYDVALFTSPNWSTSAQAAPVACNQGQYAPTSGCPTPPSGTSAACTAGPGPNPVQGNTWQNPSSTKPATVYLRVFLCPGTNPNTKLKVLVFSENSNQVLTVPDTPSGSIYGQSALPQETTVGAMDWQLVGTSSAAIEPYSSQGPVEFEYPSAEEITKPDFTGVDCVSDAGIGGFPNPFCGTSAAAPHIAALMALLMQYQPDANPITSLEKLSAMPPNPGPLTDGQSDIYGYGVPNLANAPSVIGAGTSSTSGSSNSGSGGGGGGTLGLLTLSALLGALCVRKTRSRPARTTE